MKKNHISGILYFCSFFVPVIIFIIIMAVNEFTPFGENSFLSGDLGVQIVPFMAELSEKLKNRASLFYSWNRGMGVDFLSEAAYYLTSPLNILLIFFSNKTIPLAVSLLIVLKCGFAGLNMSIYLKNHFFQNQILTVYNLITVLAFSCCYALSAYMVNYYVLIMWLDCVVMLPLVILYLEKLNETGKPFLYSLYLGISIMTNYYIGYMVCLFCVLYFLYLIIIQYDKNDKKRTLRFTYRFFKYSFLGGAISAFITIPELYALTCTYSGNLSFSEGIKTYYPAVIQIYRFMVTAYPHRAFHPYIYCGAAVFILLPLYFLNKRFPLKERILKLIILLFILSSFRFSIIEYIWNGLHTPIGYEGRNAFIAIFFILLICAESFMNYETSRIKLLLHAFSLFILMYFINQYFDYTFVFFNILKNLIVIIIYFAVIHLCRNRKPFTAVFCLLIILELAYNFNFSLSKGIPVSSYVETIQDFSNDISNLDTSEFYRIKNDIKSDRNHGALCHYNSIATVSSMANHNLLDFLSDIGFYCSLNSCNNISYEPVFSSILGEKYIISPYALSETDYLNRIPSAGKHFVYENKYSIPIGFLIDNAISSPDTFHGNNPFERINSFAYAVSGCGPVYEKSEVYTDKANRRISFDSSKDIYLYSKNLLLNTEFISDTQSIPVYPAQTIGLPVIVKAYHDNFIFHLTQGSDGGYITVPEGTDIQDITAYSLNVENYTYLMNKLSQSPICIDTFEDTRITGHINAAYDGTMLTSIPYSKGWSVYVDGSQVKTSGIQNALLAFWISQGNHTIEFKYLSPGIIPGTIVTAISLLIIITEIIKQRYIRKRSSYEKE